MKGHDKHGLRFLRRLAREDSRARMHTG